MKLIRLSEELQQPYLFPIEEINKTTTNLHIAEKILKEVSQNEDQVLLFHSASIFENDEIIQNGLVAQFGGWVEECLHGATDCEETIEEIKEKSAAVFLSETPGWVVMKARRASKDNKMNDKELVEKYGQLCLVVVEYDESGLYRAQGEKWSHGGIAQHFSEDPREELYQDDVPFGVETGDIFSLYDMEAAVTLTGKDLVLFIERNFPEDVSW